jgi:hypothetical protein
MLNWDPVYILSHRVVFHILSNPGHYLQLGHDRFLPHPFQFIIHYHPIIWLFTGCVIITAPSIMIMSEVTIYNNACVLCLGEFWRFLKMADQSEYTTDHRVVVSTWYHDKGITSTSIWELQADSRLWNPKFWASFAKTSLASTSLMRRLRGKLPHLGTSARPCSSLRATSWKQFPFPLHSCQFYWRSSVNPFWKSVCSSHTHLLVTSLPW